MTTMRGHTSYRGFSDTKHGQAGITIQMGFRNIPSNPPSNDSVYPEYPKNAPNACVRDTLAFIPTSTATVQTTSYGPSSTAILPNFNNQPYPVSVGKYKPANPDIDTYAAGYTFAGLIKNTKTDPDSNFFVPNMGTGRIGPPLVALQVAGNCTVTYNNPKDNVTTGDTVIWVPPPVTQGSSRGPALPAPAPLNWTVSLNLFKNIERAMVDSLPRAKSQQQKINTSRAPRSDASYYTQMNWDKAGDEYKRFLLTNVGVGIYILAMRGFIVIQTPQDSYKQALKDKLIAALMDASNDNKEELVDVVSIYVEEYKKKLELQPDPSPYAGHSHREISGQILGRTYSDIFNYGRDDEDFVKVRTEAAGGDTTSHTQEAIVRAQDSVTWMLKALGLGDDNTQSKQPVAANTVSDILRCCAIGANNLTNMTMDNFFETSLAPTNENATLRTFKQHIINSSEGMQAIQHCISTGLANRVLGFALSDAGATEDVHDMSENRPVLDLNLRPVVCL